MELKDFVRESLIQVVAGIEEAQTEVRDCGGFVNPAHRADVKNSNESHFGVIGTGQNVFLVDFDIAVTVVEGTGTDAKAKLNVASLLELSAGGKSNQSSSATNQIKFKVPLALPTDSVSEEQLKEQDEIVRAKRKKQMNKIRSQNRHRPEW